MCTTIDVCKRLRANTCVSTPYICICTIIHARMYAYIYIRIYEFTNTHDYINGY